jgi:hypothetical protein
MTIQSTPPSYASVHADLLYVVAEPAKTADPVAYPNYKYICDVYVGGVLAARLKRVPDPTYKLGVFNIGAVVRNYMTSLFNPTGALVSQVAGEPNFYLSVLVKFGEEYAYTSYYNRLSDTTRQFYNHYDRGTANGVSDLFYFTNRLATNAPGTLEVLQTSSFCFINYFVSGPSPVPISIVSSTGGVYHGTFGPVNGNNLTTLNIAPTVLNALSPGLITPGTQSYTVTVGSQVVRVNIVCEPIFNAYTVHFMNQYGGFETKLFSKVSRLTVNVEKKDFERLPYMVSAAGAVSYKSPNNVYYEKTYTYASQFSEKLVLNSDLLTDAEYAWLYDLVVSPLVFLQLGNEFIPVKLTDTNYESRRVANDGLTNLTINIDLGRTLNAQYR